MCSISVEPMPSTMRTPVRSNQASDTPAGSGSPAETHVRSERSASAGAARSSARYMVGAVEQRRDAGRSIASSSGSGPGLATGASDAPKRSGNSTSTPSPNVNASGGVPAKTSSGRGARMWRANVSQHGEQVAVEVHAALRRRRSCRT